jgi:nitroreductase/NAD-dependent dihydropyrimidine dehydrogenase PreA subunit
MTVDKDLCIGCQKCVKDCFPNDIEMIEGKANIKNITCMKCGHCIAVCPKNAISTDEYNMEDVKEYTPEKFSVDPENLLNFIQFRRSVRQFKNQPVEKEKISQIIQAGRFTQTATNMQDVAYTVVSEGLDELKPLVYEGLKELGTNMLEQLKQVEENEQTQKMERYASMWVNMYDAYLQNPANDKVFFNAPAIIVISAQSEINGGLAASNMELMTNALGLGTFFSGFFARAAGDNQKIMDLLGLDPMRKIVACMVIGYPEVKYVRTAPRKDANIRWI